MRIPTHIPQVTDRITSDRIKVAPAHALRAVFARIGQILMAAERITKQAQGRPGAAGDRPRSAPAASPASGREPAPTPPRPAQARWRSLDQTGNVRLLSAEDLAGDLPDPPAAVAAAETAPAAEAGAPVRDPALSVAQDAELAVPQDAELAVSHDPELAVSHDAELAVSHDPELAVSHDPELAVPPDAELPVPQGTELPVPNYDSLSVPSLRARLRGLDAAQVRVLAEYERSHAGRTDVVAMFERRIAKLAAGG